MIKSHAQKGGKKQLYKPDINMQSIIVIRRVTKPVTQSGRTTQKLHKSSKRKTGQSLLIAVKDRFKSRAKPDHIHRNKYILQETTSTLHKMSKELEAQQEAHSSVPRFGLIDH